MGKLLIVLYNGIFHIYNNEMSSQADSDDDLATIWKNILASLAVPLSDIKGGINVYTPLYRQNEHKSGVYVLRTVDGAIVYIGMSGGTSQKEAGLADRLWTHFGQASQLRKKLFPFGIDVRECNVQTYHQADLDKRNQVERYGIASFDPIGNRKIPWQPPMPNSTSFGPMKSTILNGVQCEIGNSSPVHFILNLGKPGRLGAARRLGAETNWKELYSKDFRWVICACSIDPGYDPSPLDFLEKIELTDLSERDQPQNPEKEFEQISAVAFKTFSKLNDGGVLVHCQGGRGRTGTIIGSILRHFGYDSGYIVRFLNSTYREIGKPGWPESPWHASVIERVQPLP